VLPNLLNRLHFSGLKGVRRGAAQGAATGGTMSMIREPGRKWLWRAPAALLVVLAGGLAGCSSAIDQVPTWAGGLPNGVPERPAMPPAYPAVHDMPPPRNDTVLTEAERKKLKDDLNAMRTKAEANAPATETTASVPAGTGKADKP
jgi:hypothetical protein